MQLPGFVSFLRTLSDEGAPGPVMVGEGEFGTSPPVCSGDSWVSQLSPVPSCLCQSSALASHISPLIALALTTRFLNRGLMTTH